MRSRYLWMCLFAAAAVFVIAGIYWFRFRCLGYSCIDFQRKNLFRVQSIYENNNRVYRVMLRNGRTLLRLEKYGPIDRDQARMYATARTMQILGLYEDAKSPYPGMISDRISCEEKYKPVFSRLKRDPFEADTYDGYVNDRFQYGNCISDQLAYRSKGAMFYCVKERAWYSLEFMMPLGQSSPKDLTLYVKSLRCTD